MTLRYPTADLNTRLSQDYFATIDAISMIDDGRRWYVHHRARHDDGYDAGGLATTLPVRHDGAGRIGGAMSRHANGHDDDAVTGDTCAERQRVILPRLASDAQWWFTTLQEVTIEWKTIMIKTDN